MLSATTAIIIALILFTLLSIKGIPLGFGMIGSSILFLGLTGQDIGILADHVVLKVMSSPIIMSVPIFILAGQVMNHGAISDNLLKFCLALVGHKPGGLAQVNIMSSLIFAGMSGDSTADAAGIGQVMIKMMKENKRFPVAFACAVTAASAIIGPIFPPSVPALYYAVLADTSVGALFLGGIIPALLITGSMMIVTRVISKKRNFPVEKKLTRAEFKQAMKDGIPAMLAPVILIGGIYTGFFTPSEAATVMVLYSLAVSTFYYKVMTWKKFHDLLKKTIKIAAFVLIIISGASALNHALLLSQMPQKLGLMISNSGFSSGALLALIMVIYFILGTFMSMSVMVLVVTPVIMPAVIAADINTVYFGVIIILNMMIGKITPPYGLLACITAGMNNIPVSDVFKELVPYIIVLLTSLIILAIFPELILFIPRLAGYL